MKFGLAIPNHGRGTGSRQEREAAVLAEEHGFDSVWTDDHIIVPTRFENDYGLMNESLMTLAYVAARTSKVRLGTSVIVVPQRDPILLAKQISTLDTLSKGRAILGVGTGWMEGEFGLLGAGDRFGERGRLLDESIELMRRLWSMDLVQFKGEFFSVEDGVFLPKPKRPVPIWVGGMSDAAVRRAARLGDAYHPLWTSPEGLEERVKKLRELGSEIPVSLRMPVDMHGGPPIVVRTSGTKMHRLAGSPDELTRQIEGYLAAGMQHLMVEFENEDSETLRRDIEVFSKQVMSSFG